jgi:hypothetical protein
LIGPGGIAGTGLLANTGDPAQPLPVVSGVLVASGNSVQGVADRGAILADIVDPRLPEGTRLVGRVIEAANAAGQALVRAGNGQDYLIDGLTAAPGALVNLTVGGANVLGGGNQSPLLGVSLASAGQAHGDAVTLGALSAGRPVTLEQGLATGGVVQGVVQTATGLVSGVTGGLGSGQTPVQGVVQTATGLVSGVTGGGGSSNPVGAALGLVTGALPGGNNGGQGALGAVLGPVTGAAGGQGSGDGALAGVLGTVTGALGAQGGQSGQGADGGVVAGVLGTVTGLLSGQGAAPASTPASPVGGVVQSVTNGLGGLLGGRRGG